MLPNFLTLSYVGSLDLELKASLKSYGNQNFGAFSFQHFYTDTCIVCYRVNDPYLACGS